MTRRIIIALLLIVIVGVLGKAYLSSDEFSLERFEIVGALEQEQLAKMTNKLKLYQGRNLVSMDLSELARDLLESFPWIYELSISKRLPNALKVEVSTWKPVAIIQMGNSYVIDGTGKRVAPCLDSGCPALPKIRGIGDSYFSSSVQSERISLALELMDKFKSASLQPLLVEFVGDTTVKVELSCGSTFEFLIKNALDSLEWLLFDWGASEQGLCRYGWVLVMSRGKVVIKRGV